MVGQTSATRFVRERHRGFTRYSYCLLTVRPSKSHPGVPSLKTGTWLLRLSSPMRLAISSRCPVKLRLNEPLRLHLVPRRLTRGDYRQSEYGPVLLRLTVLRRMDCDVEPTKEAVLEEFKMPRSWG